MVHACATNRYLQPGISSSIDAADSYANGWRKYRARQLWAESPDKPQLQGHAPYENFRGLDVLQKKKINIF